MNPYRRLGLRHAIMFAATVLAGMLLSLASAMAQGNATNAQTSATSPAAQRVVSVGGDATEILYALGLADSIVAVDSTSLYPGAALKDKSNVGYLRSLTTEGVLSTGAELVVANAQAGPPDVVRALKSSRVRYETLPGNESPDNIAEKIRFVGRLFGVADKAEPMARDVTQRFAALAEKRTALGKRVRAMFILGTSSGRVMIGGAGSTADIVMGLAGAENVAASLDGYKPLTDESMLSLAPEVIVTIRRDGEDNAASRIAKLPGYKETPAGKAGRIIEMDAHYLLGFGPRTPQAAEELMVAMYGRAK